MPEIIPDFNSIYTQEYWGEIPDPLHYERSGTIGRVFEQSRHIGFHHGRRLDLQTEINMEQAVAYAAAQIVAGETPEVIAEGELIGGHDDSKYAIPGNILLLDNEDLFLPSSYKNGSYENKITNEFELAASAVRLLKNGAKRETTYYTHGLLASLGLSDAPPQVKPLSDPRMVFNHYNGRDLKEGVGAYERWVHLIAFFPTKNGVGSRAAWRSIISDSGRASSQLASAGDHHIGRVGETINTTVNEHVTSLTRTRSAFVCARGAFEYATVPVKARRHILLGRFATSHA